MKNKSWMIVLLVLLFAVSFHFLRKPKLTETTTRGPKEMTPAEKMIDTMAVAVAERSVVLDGEDFHNLDVLAVAYESNEQYENAVDAQKELIDWWKNKNPGKAVPVEMLNRLAVFEKKAAEKQ